MGQITSGIGLVSGINSGAIIDELISLESQPVTLLQTRIKSNTTQQQAYAGLETQLQSLQSIGQSLSLPTTFLASTATSSDQNVLTATAGPGAPQGSYQFQVAQLVSAQQSISNGYTSTSAPMQAGTISIEMGGGNLNTQTNLADLNGGGGVSRGQFRITDRSGKTDVIDTTSAVTLDDVVNKINTSLDISVHAAIQNDHLVLTDSSGGTGSLSTQDMAGGTSAQSLGIAGNVSANTLTGSSINYLGAGTALSALNDGRGIRTTTGSGDFTITVSDGTNINVNVGTAQTMGDLIKAINAAGGTKLKASLATNAKGLTLTDTSGGGGSFSVVDTNGSHAATDLGIATTGAGGIISGKPVIAGIDTVLLGSLKGGAGVPLGQITVTDRSNATATIDLSGAKTVQDILDTINSASGVRVTAALNASGDGIQLQDSSGGPGNLTIGDTGGGTTAASLGIAGTFDTSHTIVDGGDQHLQFVSQNTTLSSYNGGKGVTPGTFSITTASGATTTVNLAQGTFTRIGDVIGAINAKNIGVTASINANGNGLLLTDTTTGAGHLTVKNVTGTTASDLNISGTAAASTIDGAMEKTIQVTGTDTLATVQTKIQALGFGVAANIINDGSAQTPYHLSVTALNSGRAGRVILDGGTTGVQVRTLVAAQDAAVFVGGAGAAQPLLVTSSTNQVTGVIPGVTLSLQSASNNPVTLSITRDPSGVAKQLQTFTDTFNGLVDKLATYTKFDTTTNQGGLLLGDQTAQEIQEQMYAVFSGVVNGAGKFRTLGDIGMTLTDGAKIRFNADTFNAAFAQQPDSVGNLFTQASTGLGSLINKSMTSLVDPVSGAITLETQTLTNQSQSFKDQITNLDAILANKRAQLESQFANMESILSGLQSQQAALGSITGIKPVAAASSSSGSSNSGTSSGSGSTSSTGA
jgi:flagellar hook-associated protein 2